MSLFEKTMCFLFVLMFAALAAQTFETLEHTRQSLEKVLEVPK